jgi:hypothetical protein
VAGARLTGERFTMAASTEHRRECRAQVGSEANVLLAEPRESLAGDSRLSCNAKTKNESCSDL